jgi:hypothetical protein
MEFQIKVGFGIGFDSVCVSGACRELFGEVSMYLKKEEAEHLKRAYTSWIGKRAHVGNGVSGILKAINVKEKTPRKGQDKLYHLEFEFENERKFGAVEFLFHNNLSEFSWFNLQRSGQKRSA